MPAGLPPYFKGRREPSNLAHLRALSFHRHQYRLQALDRDALPPTWDSREKGWVGPIKDQAQCGSCWDFSGVGTCEIAYAKAGIVGPGGSMVVFSEEYVLSCEQNGGCNGDDNTTVLAGAKTTGLPLSSAYGPYTAGGGSPSRCTWTSAETLYKINDWGFADSNGGQGITPVADIKAAIMAYGCVGCAIAADDAFMNNPPGTVFLGSGSTSIDHDIILVGWDDTKGPSGAWILRNSWGSSWCDLGYCWIAYQANQVGTEAVFALVNTPVPPAPTPTPTPPPGPTPTPTPPPGPTPVPTVFNLTGTFTGTATPENPPASRIE